MNEWTIDQDGDHKYQTLDSMAFREMLDSILTAQLPMSADHDNGIYTLYVLQPGWSADEGADADVQSICGPDCDCQNQGLRGRDLMAEYYRQTAPDDLPEGPADALRYGYAGARDVGPQTLRSAQQLMEDWPQDKPSVKFPAYTPPKTWEQVAESLAQAARDAERDAERDDFVEQARMFAESIAGQTVAVLQALADALAKAWEQLVLMLSEVAEKLFGLTSPGKPTAPVAKPGPFSTREACIAWASMHGRVPKEDVGEVCPDYACGICYKDAPPVEPSAYLRVFMLIL